MKIYAIGDLHLSSSVNKPMDIFGKQWEGHSTRIEENWKSIVTDKDIVLIPGDISWGMNMDEAIMDLEFIHKLPGRKILTRGNHDYWWQGINKLNKLYENMYFLQNTVYTIGEYGICGSRGWLCPNEIGHDERNEKIYKREAQRLKLSLDQAQKAGCKRLIVMLHYPPTNEKREPSLFTELFKDYPVTHVIYGHLHGIESFSNSIQGRHDGIEYNLVSADFISFCPKRIITI